MNSTNNTPNKTSYKAFALAEVPKFKLDLNRLKTQANDWVEYGKRGNSQALDFIEAVTDAPAHQSLIEKKQELITSEGFTYSDNIKPFLENFDADGGTVNDWLNDVATSVSVLERWTVAVRYNKLKNKIIAVDYLDASTVLPSKRLDEKGLPVGYYVCADWSNINQNVPNFYERFNPNKISETTQIYSYHKKTLGQPYFPAVSYESAMNSIKTAKALSIFNYSTIKNGFFGSSIVTVKQDMQDEEKEQFYRDLESTFTGEQNASKMMAIVSDEESPVEVTPLNASDNTGMIKNLNDDCTGKICTAHKANPIIAAIQNDGSTLGSDGKLYRDSLEIFYNTVIRGFQKPIISFLKKVLDFNGYSDYELDITSSALLASAMPIEYQADYLKPEVFVAQYGFTAEDLKPELVDALDADAEAAIAADNAIVEDVNEDVQPA